MEACVRSLLAQDLPGLRVVAIDDRSIDATGASLVASANPGCSVQLAAHLGERGATVEVVHPVELLDRALAQPRTSRVASSTSEPK